METIEQKWERLKRERLIRGEAMATPECPKSYRHLRGDARAVWAGASEATKSEWAQRILDGENIVDVCDAFVLWVL